MEQPQLCDDQTHLPWYYWLDLGDDTFGVLTERLQMHRWEIYVQETEMVQALDYVFPEQRLTTCLDVDTFGALTEG